jgi:DDE superfamily endonuclease
MQEYGIVWEDVYNMDEKGIALGLIDNAKIICHRHDLKHYALQPGNRDWASLIECVGIGGFTLPAYVIFPGQRIQTTWGKAFNEKQAMITVSPNGWTDNEISLHWLQHQFDPHTSRRLKGTHRLLIIDGHGSHVCKEFVQYCEDHRIIPLCLPPHSTHILQPLDVSVFAPLAKAYKKRVYDYNMYGAVNVNKTTFLELLYEARLDAFNEHNIASGFRKTGLYPFNPDIVLDNLRPTTPVQPPTAILRDSERNEVQVEIDCPDTAARVNALVKEVREGRESEEAKAELCKIAVTAVAEKHLLAKQCDEMIEKDKQRRRKGKRSNKHCGEARHLTVAEIKAHEKAQKEMTKAQIDVAERRKALYGKGKFAQLVWKEMPVTLDFFDLAPRVIYYLDQHQNAV